jgi:hypothetical protein
LWHRSPGRGSDKQYEQQLSEVRAQYQELMETLVPQFKTVLGTKAVVVAAGSKP